MNDFHAAPPATVPKTCYQLGFVVTSIDDFAPVLQERYGVPRFHLFPDITFAEVVYGGTPQPCSVHVAIGYCGDTQIEIVQPVSGVGVHADFIAAGKSGLHHVGFLAANFDAEVSRMSQLDGPPVQQGVIGTDRGIQFAYFDTTPALGVMTEVIWLSPSVAGMYDRLKLRSALVASSRA